ncbi:MULTISPECIES: WxL domain-containing protein [unclassified Lactococcus]|uniref:WxL domain-containing protein n=1 Tax=unclassified Lactococcus TaxID=2643510 RepID=UPI0011C93734|nr:MULTISPECIES: WxL domain-containing protein [unclassified Lactococcus]MQW22356.1 hypothetical protein [Lactococcus sp. dk101]TXK45394.1 hypothetical protein FVP42_00155 [Lactococcus sp. dk310]TXK51727.1 hypothetical protein FVP43_00155 [Lactococcus sp. dk322]
MKTSTKVFSASTTLLTLVAMGMPLVAFAAATPSPTGNTTNVTMQTTDTAQFTPGYLTIDGATNYIFPATQISSTGETVSTIPASDTWTPGTVGTTLSTPDAIDVNPSITSTGFVAAQVPFAPVTQDGVQVTDARGSNAGWSLYAYPSDLVASTNGLSLHGSTITLTGTTAINKTTGVTLPTETASTVLQTGMDNNNKTTLNAAQQVATASATTANLNATGTSELPFSSVTLTVPGIAGGANTQATTYSGVITWDLTTAP